MYKGVIFDFDGLIVDTEIVWYECFKESIHEMFSKELPIKEFAKHLGSNGNALYLFINNFIGSSVDKKLLSKSTKDKYISKIDSLELRKGVSNYLEEAKSLGLKIGLASSSSEAWVMNFLKRFELDNFFDVINTKDDVENVKPDPSLYLKTLADLNLKPNEVFVFEDSLNGLYAAKSANLECVVVPNEVTKHIIFDKMDFLLNSMDDMNLSDVLMHLKFNQK